MDHKYCNLLQSEIQKIIKREGTPTKYKESIKMGSIIRLNMNVGAKYVPKSWAHKNKCVLIVSPNSGLLINNNGELTEHVNLTSIREYVHMGGTLHSKIEGAFNILHHGSMEYDFTLRDCW